MEHLIKKPKTGKYPQKIRDSESRYKSLFENSITGVAQISIDGRLIEVNAALATLYGYSDPEEMIKKVNNVSKLYENPVEGTEILSTLKEKGETKPREISMVRRDGTRLTVLVGEREIRDTNGRVIGYQAEHVDITDRKRKEEEYTQRKEAEVKIMESESRYRTLFEYSVVPIWEQDCSGLQIFFNSLREEGIKDFRSYFRKNPEKVRYCISLVRIIDANKISLNYLGVKNKYEMTEHLSDFFIKESLDILAEEFTAFAEGKMQFEGNIPVKMPHGIRQLFFRLQVLPDYYDTFSRVMVSWIDITERIRYEKVLEESSMVLRDLNRHIEKAREDERTRISQNLHDDLGQKLTALKMDFSWLKARVGVQSMIVSEKFASMENSLDEAVGTVQRISSDLRPRILYDLGLTAAIEWQLNEFSKTTGIKCTFRVNLKDIAINDNLSIIVFRIIQESLTNVIRHSQATEVSVNLKYQKDYLNMIIRDNGIGIDQDKLNNQKSYGLMGMKERARAYGGEVKIKGAKGTGTTVHVIIPMAVE